MSTALVIPSSVPSTSVSVIASATSVAELKARATKIRQAMKQVMQPGVHYGKVPGTPKPTLFKPGSETLLAMFNIAAEPNIEDLSTEDEIRYRVTVRGIHTPSGVTVGFGVGEASTNEEKYKWRNAVCEEEFNDTDEDRRRVKWQKGSGNSGAYSREMIRTNPADLANTVLKMAKKRAQIDLTLTGLAASDVFNQDLEDLEAELRETLCEGDIGGENGSSEEKPRGKQATSAPRSTNGNGGNGQRSGGSGFATDKQLKLVGVKLDQSGIPESAFLRHFKIDSFNKLPFNSVNDALAWIANPGNDNDGDRSDDVGDGHE